MTVRLKIWRNKRGKLRNCNQGGFEPGLCRLWIWYSTAELPRSTVAFPDLCTGVLVGRGHLGSRGLTTCVRVSWWGSQKRLCWKSPIFWLTIQVSRWDRAFCHWRSLDSCRSSSKFNSCDQLYVYTTNWNRDAEYGLTWQPRYMVIAKINLTLEWNFETNADISTRFYRLWSCICGVWYDPYTGGRKDLVVDWGSSHIPAHHSWWSPVVYK